MSTSPRHRPKIAEEDRSWPAVIPIGGENPEAPEYRARRTASKDPAKDA